jgi:parvulin-like peptidyl-prolyl isomerase
MRARSFAAILSLALAFACDDKPAPPAAAASSTAASATAAPSSEPATSASSAPTASASTPPPTEIAAQHVLVAYKGAKRAPAGVTRSKADAKTRAEEVVAKAKAGDDFTSLVKSYSEDPEAQSRLGSLGKFGRDKFDKPFSDAAFALRVGEVSGVVETPFGFHVIKRNQ